MTHDLARRIAALEDSMLRGPRDDAQAIADADRIADDLEAMDRLTVADVAHEPVDRVALLARIREVRGLLTAEPNT